MERDPYEGGSDVGLDLHRELGDEPAASIRDAAPDVLAPIDASAPVSGHVPAPTSSGSAADSPEHDWQIARDLIQPAFRPVGTQGLAMESIDRDTLFAHASKSHAQPLIDEGPAGIPVVYTMGTTCCPGGSSRRSCRTRRCATWRPGRPRRPGPTRSTASAD
jgi:hypothetical protein